MIVDRYYYNQLNKSEQEVYKAFYKGVMAYQDIIPIPVKGTIADDMIGKVFSAVTRDNPLIYYLNQSTYSTAQDIFGHVAICPQYFFSEEKVKEYNRKIEKAVNLLIAELNLTVGTDYEKVLRVHDWFCRNIEYDEQGADLDNVVRVISAHNIIGVFAHHRAQCEGIAKAVKVLLNAVDVKCIVATGTACSMRENGPHAWNVVSLDNKPYHLDVTWDIGSSREASGKISYDYFIISDELVRHEHMADTKLPVCSSLELNYFTKNKLAFDSKKRLLAYVGKELILGKTEFYFRIDREMKQAEVAREVCDLVSRVLSEQGKKGIKIQCSQNSKVGTCWVRVY